MSYCRWSSMNWGCDVYVYEDCDVYVYEDCDGGWTTHVAGRRRIFPPIPDLLGSRHSMWLHRWSGCTLDRNTMKMVYPRRWRGAVYKAWLRFAACWHRLVHQASLDLIPLRPIGLPHDGESFNDDTAADCADRLRFLKAIGYIVPQHAIDELRRETTS